MTTEAVTEYKEDNIIYSDIVNPAISIDEKMILAQKVSKKFTEVIKELGLVEKISGRDYVTVSGWSVLGNFMGMRIENIQVTAIEVKRGFGYHAKLDLVNKDGYKVSEGDAIATSLGRQKEHHTVYSMAITRAMGKAYRSGLAWLVEMAGYNATPAEEMPEEERRKNNEATEPIVDDTIPANKVSESEPEPADTSKTKKPGKTTKTSEKTGTENTGDDEFNPAKFITQCENAITGLGRTINRDNMLEHVQKMKQKGLLTEEHYNEVTEIIKEEY